MDVRIGQTVESKDGKQGIVRYVGTLHIAAGSWLGLELPDQSGKNDGSLQGERYFSCQPGYGIFIRKESVVRIVKQAPPAGRASLAATTNGGAVKSRPSGVGVTAETARKRQSMMSAASSTAGSRLSVRSPTKSPTKAVSSTNSAASTPRTGTPATTTRNSDSSAKSRLSATGRPSMAPPPAPKKTTPAMRQSISGSIGRGAPTATTVKPTVPRQSMTSSRLSLHPKSPPPKAVASTRSPSSDEDAHPQSPTADECDGAPEPLPRSIDQVLQSPHEAQDIPSVQPDPAPSEPTHSRTTSVSRSNMNAETRAADKKELEQLKAKLRTLERKAAEDREKLQRFDSLQTDKDRYETIIQTLQKKLKTNQQSMTELRTLKEEAERKAKETPIPSGELESELELANLDREMAEERAELAQAELEEFRAKHEEAELELEILREENRELNATMSPEELSSAGWLQKEREIERLRRAVGLLRDHSKETEEELQSQIKELQETVDEAEKLASMYQEAATKLTQLETTNKHLMEQLEDAETNDEVVVALETQREQSAATIEQLKRQIQEFEEHIQVTDELEKFHLEEEKQLHHDLDEAEALLNERHRQTDEQEKVIGDLEFTLSKFREVVSGLQGDIDELRQSRDLNETQAHEMSAKSRAVMDLNMQLQNSAAKTQLKTIDFEMRDMQAEQARSHLDIVQQFVPDNFEQDRNPVLAMLALKRIKSKATLVRTLLTERMRDRYHLAQDDPFSVFEVMEKMDRIACSCERFLRFVHNCSPEQFQQFSGALYELEPVERSVTGWVEALRRDELGTDGPEAMQRVIGVILDMADKLIVESNETKATELIEQTTMADRYAEVSALELTALTKAVQQRLGLPRDDDEEALVFDKKLDSMAAKARTIRYLCSKVTQALAELRATSMCLGETAWVFFEDASQFAEQYSHLIRTIGRAVISELNKVEHEEPLTYTSITDLMLQSGQAITGSNHDSVYTLLAAQLSSLASKIDDLSIKSADFSSATEFESSPTPPWTARAKQLKQQKLVSQDTAGELARLKARSDGQLRDLADKNKEAEELRIRVEVLESRQREAKAKDGELKALKDEIEHVKAGKALLEGQVEATKAEIQAAADKHAKEREELDTLRAAALADGTAGTAAQLTNLGDVELVGGGSVWRAEADLLKSEILSLQATVRYLRTENHSLRVPVGEVAMRAENNAWLDPLNLKARAKKDSRVQLEGKEILEGLIELASSLKSVKLKPGDDPDLGSGGSTGRWRSIMGSNRLLVARQREEVERWMAEVEDVKRRARLEGNAKTSMAVGRRKGAGYALPSLPLDHGTKAASLGMPGGDERKKVVRIVGVDV